MDARLWTRTGCNQHGAHTCSPLYVEYKGELDPVQPFLKLFLPFRAVPIVHLKFHPKKFSTTLFKLKFNFLIWDKTRNFRYQKCSPPDELARSSCCTNQPGVEIPRVDLNPEKTGPNCFLPHKKTTKVIK